MGVRVATAISGATFVTLSALGLQGWLILPAAAASTPPASAAAGATGLAMKLDWSVGPLNDSGAPIAESSPILANLPGGPAAVVGDRAGNLYAYYLAGDGSGGSLSAPGWPVSVGAPVDSTPSAVSFGGSSDTVFVGSGDDQYPTYGGYHAYSPTGAALWRATVVNPSQDAAPAGGVSAGLTVATLQGVPAVMAGSLGQVSYALNAFSGSSLSGWPFFTSDSTHSTAAATDLYGDGQTEMVEGGDQTAGFAHGQTYDQGGHLRIISGAGALICNADVDQTVDSSPAVGGFLPGGATGEVIGTGTFFPGAKQTDDVLAFGNRCQPEWSTTLDHATTSSPALADVLGNGHMEVVEGTADQGTNDGSVWLLAGTSGATICHAAATGQVIGSVVTADLTGNGTQDMIVPTTFGVDIFDSNCDLLDTIAGGDSSSPLGFQNSPLVTDDPDGSIGITVAGYGGPNGGSGYIEHYEVVGSNGSSVSSAGAWPMFHHDPLLTGDAGATTPAGRIPTCDIPTAVTAGYDLVTADGALRTFGPPDCGSARGLGLATPVVGMALAPLTGGYWLATSGGGVFSYGGARFYGSGTMMHLGSPIVGIVATADGRGYWLVAGGGGVFAFGDARYLGAMSGRGLRTSIVGMAANPDGQGYWLVSKTGGIYAFGDAQYLGSMAGHALAAPMVGVAFDAATGGYWEVAADGTVFSYSALPFGSPRPGQLRAPVVAIEPTLDGMGYYLVAADGQVLTFGDASSRPATGGQASGRPVTGIAGF